MSKPNIFLALIAGAAIAVALFRLHTAGAGVAIAHATIDGTPALIYRPTGGGRAPVVVIAHGFAGSQVLMRSFALTFARNGYIAVTFDFPGHGRNPRPLTGDIADTNGATRVLVEATRQVLAFARELGDGRVALLGHSMASDIVVRVAETTPGIGATIAVSMFSPAVTPTLPHNLLIIVGDWESMLKREAMRAVGLATAPVLPLVGVTYGDLDQGTARRAAYSPHVEHASVLFSRTSMREALAWLDQAFHMARTSPPLLDERGPWILWLIAAVVVSGRPLAALLPRLAEPPVGAARPWRRLWFPLVIPAVATPLLLRVLPTHFLPVLVGDYLAVHFALYGLITALCLIGTRAPGESTPTLSPPRPAALAAAGAVIAFGFTALVWPIDEFVTSFVPGPHRFLLILVMLVGTSMFFLSDEWLTRGRAAARGAYLVSKAMFLLSLAGAVALDLQRLFFLIIIIPVILLFFIVYGLFSGWIYRRTGHPWVAGVANAVAFAWAIGCTFPLLAG